MRAALRGARAGAEKAGKSVIYHLKLSVLEEALLGFVQSFGLGDAAQETKKGMAK